MADKKTIYERAEIGERAVYRLREIVKDKPLEVIGHLDSRAICCGNGTVALVEVDLDKLPKRRK